jgi:predicted nucleic acid-binding protein
VATVGHCLIEAYSVLTRLPEPQRVSADLAAQALERLVGDVHVLDATRTGALPGELRRRGIFGGAVYDGLIALTAAQFGATLLTLDARAARTYRACGIDFELLS